MDKQEVASVTDVVVFFDANMPKMDVCRDGCSNDATIFCRHRFGFNGCLIDAGNLCGLSDLKVVRRFFDLIDRVVLWRKGKKPWCVLVTKDHDFINDVKMDYFDELQNGVNDIKLNFSDNSITSCIPEPAIEIVVLVIKHKPYGSLKKDNLHEAIQKLNQFWSDPRSRNLTCRQKR